MARKNKSQNNEKTEKSQQAVSPRPVAPKNLAEETQSLSPGKVKMKFSEHKYYNDLNEPIFRAGEVYELEGAEWIQRWLKRGGVIVEGNLEMPSAEPNPSTVETPPADPEKENMGDNLPTSGETDPESTGKDDETAED